MIIKDIRKKKNIPVVDLCKSLGISQCNYYKKEMGQIRFSLDEARTLSLLFDITIEDLFFNNEYSNIA